MAPSVPRLMALLLVLVQAAAIVAADRNYEGCEIAVIGAGIGGVYSAWRLAVDAATVSPRSICIFEAKDRPGGRILTVNDPVPGFEDFVVDLGAYRYVASNRIRLLQGAEDALNIQTQCYTDPLELDLAPCGEAVRQIVTTRGKIFGITSDGRRADDAFEAYTPRIPYNIMEEWRWGPGQSLEEPRKPSDFLVGENSVVKEIAERYGELVEEKDYEKAMQIVDEILVAMRNGSYHGIPYSEVSLLQVATKEGLTSEELLLFLDTDYDVGNNYGTRQSLERISQVALRRAALLTEPIGLKAMVVPVEMRDGELRKIGMKTIVEKMLAQAEAAGVRVFYNAKVISMRRTEQDSKTLVLGFDDGTSTIAKKAFANIGKPDLVALGLSSEPFRSSTEGFKKAVERLLVVGLSKTYCFWEDAWWLTKLKTTFGRTRTASEDMFSMRYHDGDVTCDNKTELTGCRGGVLVSYVLGDNKGFGNAIHVNSFNALRYTPLTNRDNVRRLIPGNMTGIERLYFDGLHEELRRVHASSLMAKGFKAASAIPNATGCIFGDWRDVGTHGEVGPGKGDENIYELFTKPVDDLDVAMVNEAWGQERGWAEASLHSAERALYHQYGLERPDWMDESFHASVIRKYNIG